MKFSKIAHLGKFSQYTKVELIQKLEGYRYFTTSQDEFSELVRFEGEGTILELRFDLSGKFIEMVAESWQDVPMTYHKYK
jgi:regulator of sigma D